VEHPAERALSCFMSVAGVLFLATILGITCDFVRVQMDELRVPKARVTEKDHVVIVGWTNTTLLIIHELVETMRSGRGGVIVVLAQRDTDEMANALAWFCPKLHGTRVVFRCGCTANDADLYKLSAHTAKAVIIQKAFSETLNDAESDAMVLRTFLMLRGMSNTFRSKIIIQVSDHHLVPVLTSIGGSMSEIVCPDILGRLMVRVPFEPGLDKLFMHLLGREGADFYYQEFPVLENEIWQSLSGRFDGAIPIGVVLDCGRLMLNPPAEMKVGRNYQIVCLANDAKSYTLRKSPRLGSLSCAQIEPRVPKQQKLLVCGWRDDFPDIIALIDRLVGQGSEVHILSKSVTLEERNIKLKAQFFHEAKLKNVRVVHIYGDPTSRRKLESLAVNEYRSCIIYADQAGEMTSTLRKDAEAMLTYLLLHDLTKNSGIPCSLVVELLDPFSSKIVAGLPQAKEERLAGPPVFIESNKIIALLMAMVIEKPKSKRIFDELLSCGGTTISMVPAENYVTGIKKDSFYMMASRVAAHNLCLLGYCWRCPHAKPVLNPENKAKKRAWHGYDLVVLGSDRTASEAEVVASDDEVAPDADGSDAPAPHEDKLAEYADMLHYVATSPSLKARKQFVEMMDLVAELTTLPPYAPEVDRTSDDSDAPRDRKDSKVLAKAIRAHKRELLAPRGVLKSARSARRELPMPGRAAGA